MRKDSDLCLYHKAQRGGGNPDLGAEGAAQGGVTLPQRRPGGEDIVHQQDVPRALVNRISDNGHLLLRNPIRVNVP